ncbi:hypothetical protein HYR99_29320 [Candidatus Poribacteria bacterium]|nr:hypothetical protein [Candidatus Poribacteria bacterium]
MNNANYNIRCKSWLWNLVPLAGRNQFSSTIGNTIYLTPKRWEDYASGNPSPHTTALIEHEATHVRQSNREGQFRFSIQYLFSRKYLIFIPKAKIVPKLRAEVEKLMRDGHNSSAVEL